jgi:hypothetical protein
MTRRVRLSSSFGRAGRPSFFLAVLSRIRVGARAFNAALSMLFLGLFVQLLLGATIASTRPCESSAQRLIVSVLPIVFALPGLWYMSL